MSRLDPGGITLDGVDVRSPGAYASAFSAGKLSVDLDWANLFAPRASVISGDGLTVRLNLSGLRPVLGDLDPVMRSLPSGGGGGGPPPKVDIQNVRVIADTLLGPVEARGFVTMESASDFHLEMKAQPTRLSAAGARIDLAAAEMYATAKDGAISARARVDLSRLEVPGAHVSDFALNLDVVQATDGLHGAGGVRVGEVAVRDQTLNGVSADAKVNAAQIDLGAATPQSLLAALQSIVIVSHASAGEMAGAGWRSIDLNLAAERGKTGTATFVAEGVKLREGEADRVEVKADITLGDAGFAASGVVSTRQTVLSETLRDTLGEAIERSAGAIVPGFAPALARALDQAARSFAADIPWSVNATEAGMTVALGSGAAMRSASGFSVGLDGGERDTVAAWKSTGGWSASGTLQTSGGGGPQVRLAMRDASFSNGEIKLAGEGEMKPWRVGEEVLSLRVSDLALESRESAGHASGDITLGLSGGVAGGVWTGAKAVGAVSTTWTKDGLVADAPRGLGLSWTEGRYGKTVIGKGSLRYSPAGRLAQSNKAGLAGAGVLSATELPVSGDAFTARAALGKVRIDWTIAGKLLAKFDADPARIWLAQSEGEIPIVIDDVTGIAEVAAGWKVSGKVAGGSALANDASVDGVKGGFELSGAGGALNGRLSDVSLRVSDALPVDKRRFEAAAFAGAAKLADGVADFSGAVTLVKSGVQLANVSGRHDLATGSGGLTFAPTLLIFEPRVFEPSALSPLLRGPANVTGRVEVSGAAAWTADGLTANARAQFRKLGFAIANAGVFEGVSGTIDVSDLLAMKSAPGQTLTIDKVTLGIPFEMGVVSFQLVGFDGVRVESAQWPFAGGSIRLTPADVVFSRGTNRLVAEAVNWDLRALIEQFKVPDVNVQGRMNGTFPVVFSTGSARIDHALLQASEEGGVIQYSGSTADVAGQSDQSAKLLFDALKDFQYRVLQMELDGDLAGSMVLKLTLRGNNPNVLRGQPFDVNISLDSPLISLLNMTSNANQQVDAIVDAIIGQPD